MRRPSGCTSSRRTAHGCAADRLHSFSNPMLPMTLPAEAPAFAGAAATTAPAAQVLESWRPRHHFTPQRHWMNDPNGPVMVDGVYHLYYQYNPHGDQWGDISWGHATSADGVHWTEHAVALPCTDTQMVFSGTVVVDAHNTSGLAPAGFAGRLLVALYTGFDRATQVQSQHLAYSLDGGFSFQRYTGNPVLDIGSKEFRDPKVFWHAPTGRWVMLLVRALEQQMVVYTAPDLVHWTERSRFGPAGSCDDNIWEMPDLFALPVEGQPGISRWVLIISVNRGSLWGGSGVQYFVGDFDGTRFVADEPVWRPGQGGEAPPLAERTRWADHGRDFYAPLSVANLPGEQVQWLGWMSNWAYANALPTAPWRGQQSMLRSLSLVDTGHGLRLRQAPAEGHCAELAGDVLLDLHDCSGGEAMAAVRVARLRRDALRIELSVARAGLHGAVTLEVLAGEGDAVQAGFDPQAAHYLLRRTAAVPRFAGDGECHTAVRMRPADADVVFDLWVDRSTVELFADDGLVVISDLAYGDPASTGVALRMADPACRVRRLRVATLSGQG